MLMISFIIKIVSMSTVVLQFYEISRSLQTTWFFD